MPSCRTCWNATGFRKRHDSPYETQRATTGGGNWAPVPLALALALAPTGTGASGWQWLERAVSPPAKYVLCMVQSAAFLNEGVAVIGRPRAHAAVLELLLAKVQTRVAAGRRVRKKATEGRVVLGSGFSKDDQGREGCVGERIGGGCVEKGRGGQTMDEKRGLAAAASWLRFCRHHRVLHCLCLAVPVSASVS